jgi:hypothetical protein
VPKWIELLLQLFAGAGILLVVGGGLFTWRWSGEPSPRPTRPPMRGGVN